jgi:hypothetical protein
MVLDHLNLAEGTNSEIEFFCVGSDTAIVRFCIPGVLLMPGSRWIKGRMGPRDVTDVMENDDPARNETSAAHYVGRLFTRTTTNHYSCSMCFY